MKTHPVHITPEVSEPDEPIGFAYEVTIVIALIFMLLVGVGLGVFFDWSAPYAH